MTYFCIKSVQFGNMNDAITLFSWQATAFVYPYHSWANRPYAELLRGQSTGKAKESGNCAAILDNISITLSEYFIELLWCVALTEGWKPHLRRPSVNDSLTFHNTGITRYNVTSPREMFFACLAFSFRTTSTIILMGKKANRVLWYWKSLLVCLTKSHQTVGLVIESGKNCL